MKKKSNFLRNFALISQLSINIMVPVFLCLLFGMWLDSLFQTSFLAVLFLILGVLGGGKSAYSIAMNSLRMEKKEEETPEEIVARYHREHDKGVCDDRVSQKNKSGSD